MKRLLLAYFHLVGDIFMPTTLISISKNMNSLTCIFTRVRYELDNVNHVLNSHKGSRIKEFRFDVYRCGMFDEIGRCFEFALTRKAEIIHISPSHHTFHRLPDRNGLKCLKDLSLINNEMTGQYFQFVAPIVMV